MMIDVLCVCPEIIRNLTKTSVPYVKLVSLKSPVNDCASLCVYKLLVYITEQETKGRRDVDFPLDDYFMSLAVLATCRSVLPKNKVRVRTSL